MGRRDARAVHFGGARRRGVGRLGNEVAWVGDGGVEGGEFVDRVGRNWGSEGSKGGVRGVVFFFYSLGTVGFGSGAGLDWVR